MKAVSLSQIFLNNSIQEEVTNVHNSFKKDYPKDVKTFREAMSVTLDNKYYPDVKDLLSAGIGKFNKLKLPLNIKDISVLESRIKIFPLLKNYLDKKVSDASVFELEDASLIALKPSQAFAFKALVLYLNKENHYQGMLPYTTAVDKATNHLFYQSFKNNQFRHTLFCRDLALELNVSAMYINTALWIMGQELK